MNKSQLIKKISERNPHLSYKDVDLFVNSFFKTLKDALITGNRIEIRGFGTFSLRKRESHFGFHPKTNAPIFIKEKWIPVFKAGKALREVLNEDYAMSVSTKKKKQTP